MEFFFVFTYFLRLLFSVLEKRKHQKLNTEKLLLEHNFRNEYFNFGFKCFVWSAIFKFFRNFGSNFWEKNNFFDLGRFIKNVTSRQIKSHKSRNLLPEWPSNSANKNSIAIKFLARSHNKFVCKIRKRRNKQKNYQGADTIGCKNLLWWSCFGWNSIQWNLLVAFLFARLECLQFQTMEFNKENKCIEIFALKAAHIMQLLFSIIFCWIERLFWVIFK